MNAEQERALALLESMPESVLRQALTVLERLADRDPTTGPWGWQVGLRYTERGPGRATCAIEVDESHFNPGHVAHGALVFTLADSAMGAAVHTLLEPGQRTVTAEIKLNYLAPVTHGRVHATATVVSKRRRLAVVTAEVRDARDELVGLAQGTFAIIHASAPQQSES
jgi:acyl-CoA thioesterase